MQIVTKLIANLAVTTAKINDLAVTTGKIAADAVNQTKILLANNTYLRGRNAANNADINILRVNAADAIESSVLWTFPTILPQSAVVPVSPDDLVNKAYVDGQIAAPATWGFEQLVLSGTDITNQYVDLAEEVTANSLTVTFSGVVQEQGADYTLSLAGSVTRITFAGDLATGGAAELVAADELGCRYTY